MGTNSQTGKPPAGSWRDTALERSEIITDAWEVTKTYAGRLAEWVLFLCMIMNIIEILVTLPSALSNIVLGTQVVMLDVGGFSLASMADHASEQGDVKAARTASVTGYFLIAVTILTLLLVTLGILWPQFRDFTNGAEKGLILVRVVMTVIYAHVIHSLRRGAMHIQKVQTQAEEMAEAFGSQIGTMEQRIEEQALAFTRQIEKVAKSLEETEQNMSANSINFRVETGRHFDEISQQFQREIASISEQLSIVVSSLNSLQKPDGILQETDTNSSEELDESDESETASEADEAKAQGRRYHITFEEASELTGLTILQLKRRVNAGEIEVNSKGKVRVKSLQNLSTNPSKKAASKSKDTQKLPALIQFPKAAER